MATLEKIRNKYLLLISIIGFALFAFIIGDLINSGSSFFGRSATYVGSVEGEELSVMKFNDEASTYSEIIKMVSSRPMTDADAREAVWQNFVQSTLLRKKAEELGFSVSTVELRDVTVGDNIHPMVRQIPIFMNENGLFDKNIVVNILRFIEMNQYSDDPNVKAQAENLKNIWSFWERQIVDRLYSDKMTVLMSKAMSATKAEVAAISNLSNKNFDVLLAKKQFTSVSDSAVAVSEADKQKYYNDHKDDFKTENGYRSIKIVTFPVSASAQDMQNAKAAMEDVRNQLKSVDESDVQLLVSSLSDDGSFYRNVYLSEKDIDPSYGTFAFTAAKDSVAEVSFDGSSYKTAKVVSDVVTRPDSVKVCHIMIQKQTPEATRKEADSLMALINSGVAFDSLLTFSVDKQSAANGGELGWVKEGMLSSISGFDSLAFQSKSEKVHLLESVQGMHLMKITERTAPVKKVKIAVISSKLEPSSETYNYLYNKANQFAVNHSTLPEFEKGAKDSLLNIVPIVQLEQNQSRAYMFENFREVVKWAWSSELNSVSNVFDIDGVYVVAAVSEVVEPGFVPLANVMSSVEKSVRNEKKSEMLVSEFNAMNEDAFAEAAKDTLKGVRFGMSYVNGVGVEPSLIGAICASKGGEISKAVAGASGVYRFKVLSSADETSFSASLAEENSKLMNCAGQGLFTSLRKDAEIIDNRSNFY